MADGLLQKVENSEGMAHAQVEHVHLELTHFKEISFVYVFSMIQGF